jgi:hypothetical protein
MRFLIGCLVALVAVTARGADKDGLVPVPGDYGGIEIPVGGSIALKKELILPGSSTEAKVFERTSKDGTLDVKTTCTLYYEADWQRRKIPAGVLLPVQQVAKNPFTAAPGSCWKDGKPREASGVIFSLSTLNGFVASLYCSSHMAWLGSERYQEYDSDGNLVWRERTIACRHAGIPDVSDLSADLEAWAPPYLLEKVIGFD